jgi:thiamine-monophosphate kinase
VQDAEQPRGEFDLIARFFAGLDAGPDVALGNGDDAAVLRLGPGEELVVSADAMLEDVHFPLNSPPADIAYRAVAAAVSDLAAMGARPVAMTLALSLALADEAWLGGFREGLVDAVSDFSLPLVGGDLTRGPLALTVQVMGAVPAGAALRRRGASPGELLYVSGDLGAPAAGLAVLRGELALPEPLGVMLKRRFWRPAPALALATTLRGQATSAIDVSDGLLADAGHLARASGVRLCIESERLPIAAALRSAASPEQVLQWALAGGEDYVLCFTLPAGLAPPAGCTRIGHVEQGCGVHCDHAVDAVGYRHF